MQFRSWARGEEDLYSRKATRDARRAVWRPKPEEATHRQ